MSKIKKIIFPVDFSDSCRGAARYVAAFAGKFDAEVMLLHAVGLKEDDPGDRLLLQRKAQLDAFLADEFKGFTTHRVCAAGEALSTIVEEASSWHPDLLMLPTHGLGYFRRHLLGSVAAKVLHDLQCPVWTTVHAEAAPAEVVPCERILCAVDLTARSRSVLDYASWLAREYGARLGIVHAPSAIDVSVAFSAGDEFQQAVLDRAAKGVETLQQQAGTSAEVFINPGSPPTIIAAAAQLFRADLLVIGRHMGEGLPGELFQSAYGILTESPCPVISI